MAGRDITFTLKGVDHLSGTLKNISGEFDKLGKDISKSTDKGHGALSKLSGAIGGVAKVAAGVAAGGFIALGGAIAGSIKIASSFESAFAGIIKTTDGLTDSTGKLTESGEKLRKQFTDLTKEIPLTFEELAHIGELGGQLGIPQEALKEFTETVAALGVSTNLSTEEAATSLARMSNIFAIKPEEMGENIARLGATIVDLGNNFATTEAEITAFGERIAGAGKIAGLSQADVLGIGAALSSVGVEAEAGGTAVQKVLLDINNAVNGSATGFTNYNEQISDNVNKITSLTGKLMTLEAQTGLTGDQIIAMRDEFVASGGSVEEFGRQLGDTKRRQLYETAIAIQELTAETQTLRNENGKPIDTGNLAIFARTAGMTADEFKKAWQEDAGAAFQAFVEGLGEAGDGAAGILDELGLADQRLIRSFLSLAGSGDLLERAMDKANVAFYENTALSEEAAKRYATVESKFQMFKNVLQVVADTLGSRLLPFVARLLDFGTKLIGDFSGPLANILDNQVVPALDNTIASITGLMDAFETGGTKGLFEAAGLTKDQVSAVQEVIDSITRAIQGGWPAIWGELQMWGNKFWDWLTGNVIPLVSQKIGEATSSIAEYLAGQWSSTIYPKLIEWGTKFWDWTKNIISTHPEYLGGLTGIIAKYLYDNWGTISQELTKWGNQFWNWITETTIPLASQKITQVATGIAGYLTEQWNSTIYPQLTKWGQDFWKWITETAIPQAPTKIAEIANSIVGFLTEQWNGVIYPYLATWGNLFFNWVTETAIPAVSTKLNELTTAIAGYLTEQWDAVIYPALLEWGNKAFEWVATAYANIPTYLTELTKGVGDFLRNDWPTIHAALLEWGGKFWEWVDIAIKGIGAGLAGLALALAAWASSPEAQQALTDLGNDIATTLIDLLKGNFENTEQMTSVLTTIGATLLAVVGGIGAALIAVGASIVAGIIEGILEHAGIDIEPATIGELSGVLTGIGQDLKTIVTVVGNDIITGIVDGIKEMAANVGTALTDAGQSAIDTFKSFLGISSPSTLFMGFGTDLMQGLIDGIKSMLGGVTGALGEIASGIAEKGKGLFTGIFGGGGEEVEGPTMNADAFTLDPTQMQDAILAVQTSLNNLVIAVNDFSSITLTDFATAWTNAGIVIGEALLNLRETGILPTDLTIQNIYNITLPILQTIAENTAAAITTAMLNTIPSFDAVIAAIERVKAALNSLGNIGKRIGDEIANAMDNAAEGIDNLVELIQEAIEAFEDMAAAAREAANAANEAGSASGASSGIGFHRGIGFSGGVGFAGGLGLGWTVPAGYPNDSFGPLFVESGEEMLISPRGTSIEEIVMSRLAGIVGAGGDYNDYRQYNLTIHTSAPSEDIVQDFALLRSMG